LLQEEALRIEVGERVYQHVRGQFGLDSHRDQLFSIIEN
jgi:hypothetical protein